MKTINFYLILITLLAFGSVSSCKKLRKNCRTKEVKENITEPTKWKSKFVYIIKSDLIISSELTIEPGTVVKLDGVQIEIIEGGKKIANGKSNEKIIFTSLKDDQHCGDSNDDKSGSSPQKGDWVGVLLNGTQGSTFDNVEFLYAGKTNSSGNFAVKLVSNSTFSFNNCLFAHTYSDNSMYSIAFEGGYLLTDEQTQQIENCAFYDNDIPIEISVYYNLSVSNLFHNPASLNEKNKRNFVYLKGNEILMDQAYWNITEIPYVSDDYIQLDTGAKLTIANNVIVKFVDVEDGLSSSKAEQIVFDNSIIFTSYKDDLHGGDSNADGNITSPTIGDWYGIYNNYPPNFDYQTGPNILYAAN